MKFLIFNIVVITALGFLFFNQNNRTITQGPGDNKLTQTEYKLSKIKNDVKEDTIEPLVNEASDQIKQKQIENQTQSNADTKDPLNNLMSEQISELNTIKVKTSDTTNNQTKPTNIAITVPKNHKLTEAVIEVKQRIVKFPEGPTTNKLDLVKPTQKTNIEPLDNIKIKQVHDLMTPTERRSELNRLAQEMELIFIKKLNM